MPKLPVLKSIVRGDYEPIEYTVPRKDDPSLPLDLTGYTVRFTAKAYAEAPTALVSKDSTIGDEIEILDPAAGEIRINIESADTADIPYAMTMICDVEATKDGRPQTSKFYLPLELDITS